MEFKPKAIEYGQCIIYGGFSLLCAMGNYAIVIDKMLGPDSLILCEFRINK